MLIDSDMPGNHNYEDLKETLYRLMTEALLEGRKVVTAEDVERISGGVDLETIRKRAGVTKKQLAEETGLSAPTVAKLLNNKDESTLTSSGKENKNTLRGVLESHGMNVEPESKQAAMG